MKYMLLLNTYAGEQPITEWSPGEIKAHIDFMNQFNTQLTEAGEWVSGEGLTFPDQAKVVRATESGAPAVTDGPFPESKEFLMGYWIVDVESPERAVELAAEASAAPGPGGTPLNMPVEVRQVGEAPDVEL
ncbi:MAG: YciI family protein [Micromonosporaceae bacterium]